MKTTRFSIIMVQLSILFCVYAVEAEPNVWTNAGPNGTKPACFTITADSELIIGTQYKGVYKKNLNGGEWVSCHTGLIDSISTLWTTFIEEIPGNPGELVIGFMSPIVPSLYNYLYHSIDYGANWEPITIFTPPSCTGSTAFWIDPSDNQHWLWAGHSVKLYHTYDGGNNWENINPNDNPGVYQFYSLPGNSNIVFNLSICRSPQMSPIGGIMRSDDSGRNWTQVWNVEVNPAGEFVEPHDIKADPFDPDHIVAVSDVYPEIYSQYRWMESFDGGINWQNRLLDFPSLFLFQIVFDPSEQGTIYLGTIESGAFKSTDNGVTWTHITSEISRGGSVHAMKMDENGHLYVTFYKIGAFRSTDGGESWEDLTQNIDGGQNLQDLNYNANGDILCSGDITLNLYADENWQRIDEGIPLEHGIFIKGVFDPINPEKVFAGVSNRGNEYLEMIPPNLWWTDDSGANWNSVNNQPLELSHIFHVDNTFTGDSRILVGDADGQFWFFDTQTEVWENISPTIFYNPYYGMTCSPIVDGLMYYPAVDSVQRSDNWGQSWTDIFIPNIGFGVHEVFPDGVYPDILWAGVADNYPLRISHNRGDTWETVEGLYISDICSVNALYRSESNTDIIIAATKEPYISYDNGETWDLLVEGLNYSAYFNEISAIGGTDSLIWASTSDGVKVLELAMSSVANNELIMVEDFSFSAYPNPFNSSAIFSFSLNKPGRIELVVYDLQGREVTILETGYYLPGNYSTTWNAGSVSSGIYFLSLKQNDHRSAIPIIHIK